MAPHLTPAELDKIRIWHGKAKLDPVQVHEKLLAWRTRRGLDCPDLANVRRVLRGESYRQGLVETRGKKRLLTRRQVLAMNSKRKELIKKAEGEHEVRWKDVIKKTRGVTCHRATASRAFKEAGLDVKWRRAREKPKRGPDIIKERLEICSKWQRLPARYYVDQVDMIIDNKKWPIPTSQQARRYLLQHRVRGHIRTPQEGLKPEFTKPSPRKHRRNPGGCVNLCAGVSGGRIVLWEYLYGPWGGNAAVALYEGPILKTLQKTRGVKRRYTILQDNDPRGYQAKKAVDARTAKHMCSMDLPRYSPDLNPLDYGIWDAVQRQLDKQAVKGKETVAAFKARLRRTALRLPRATVEKVVLGMKKRLKAVVAAKGHDISVD
jgi:hypothetical protein